MATSMKDIRKIEPFFDPPPKSAKFDISQAKIGTSNMRLHLFDPPPPVRRTSFIITRNYPWPRGRVQL